MKPLALRTQLTLFYTGILALLVAVLGLAYYQVLARQLDADATADLEELTAGLHGYLSFRGGQPTLDYDQTDPEQVSFIDRATRFYQIYDANTGRLLVQSPALEPLGLHYTPSEVQALREQPRTRDMQTDRGRIRFSNSLLAPSPGNVFLLQVGVSLAGFDAALARFLRLLLWSVPTGLVLAVAVGRWMAGRALAPLARLAAATRGIDVPDLRRRLPVRGAGDELDEVTLAFNETLDRLEQAMAEMRQFSAAIAHELRTPLAALRGETELALMRSRTPDEYRRGLASQLEELDKLARLITQLLTLARAEAGEIPLTREPVDLAALAASIVEQLEPVAQARDVELTCQAQTQVMTMGDAAWLERLLLNLLDNALKFTPPGGRIRVRAGRDEAAAVLEVCDTGIGIPEESLQHVFERFYRVDPSRSSGSEGVGLGLSLVKWIADRHGATVDVSSREAEGTTFLVRFPRLD